MLLLSRIGICVVILLNATVTVVSAQTNPNEDSGDSNWKFWCGGAIGMAFSKKAELSFGYLQSYDLGQTVRNNFNQSSASFSYDVSKRFNVKAGIIQSKSPSAERSIYRYFIRSSLKVNVGDKCKWTNAVQVEKHSSNENRFNYRFIYITRLELRKRIDFLRLSPSVAYWIFYNVGGSKIQYYDPFGNPTVRDTPDGIHRGRLWINLNSKVNDVFSIAVFYIMQNEFNVFNTDRGLNIVNPSSGKITRAFNNYNVAGLTLKIDLDL